MVEVNSAKNVTSTPHTVRADLDRLRETTGQVVGSVFFGTLLKTMRESPFKGRYGHGGRGEEIFTGQLHGLLAERMGAVTQRGMGHVIFRALERQQQLTSRQRELV